ncbi:MAG TPA: hypothetical protein VN999_17870 [Thermoanaerobaculia bacterium]|nr:hypothetical protein [Thermoanaerobaculia bacterium]
MDVHRWKDLNHKMGMARRQELRQAVEQEIADMDLRGLRELMAKTQKDRP